MCGRVGVRWKDERSNRRQSCVRQFAAVTLCGEFVRLEHGDLDQVDADDLAAWVAAHTFVEVTQ
jgi:hypothetical protein